MTTDTVLVLSKNEYDLYTLDGLWDELQDAVPCADMTIDFRNVRYIDGASLGVLVKYAKSVKHKHHSRVHIVRANPLVQRILRITGLDRIFDVPRTVA